MDSFWNLDFVERQYLRWKESPQQLPSDWQFFFKGFEWGTGVPSFPAPQSTDHSWAQSQVERLIYRYRNLGHLIADANPLEKAPEETRSLFEITQFGLDESSWPNEFYARHFSSTPTLSLREIVDALQETYCGAIGVEYMHIQNPQERVWLEERMESCRNRPQFGDGEKVRILHKLYQAARFERFLHTRYLGQKRFSIEGGESLIPLLDTLIDALSGQGCEEIVMGMAHRGRLNVLVNVLFKLYEEIFCEFDDNYDPHTVVGSSDVRYHKGFLSDLKTRHGTVRLLLAPNPSHLESVGPVVQGIVRARQLQAQDENRDQVAPLLIHGDAAFSGQGVVAETLNLSQLKGYRTGGTLHVVIDNQIGFTTLPEDSRSTRYCTDMAKMLMVPIFHVNGENPQEVCYVARLASEYRMRFHKDVVIDLLCYRRHGHNEGDEPLFTQPTLYDKIKGKAPVHEAYGRQLLAEGKILPQEIEKIEKEIDECLEEGFKAAKAKTHDYTLESFYAGWEKVPLRYSVEGIETAVSGEKLRALSDALCRIPQAFSAHPKIKKMLEKRNESVQKGGGIDWGNGESLAFASLVDEGTPIRLSGQDSRRGTFSQRHAALYDLKTGAPHIPLQSVGKSPFLFTVYDSALSEAAVLGFEYGYAMVDPQTLTIWEAQFGDFANSAQVVIDQYVSSAESKWGKRNGLVMLLPHGYEGQGPEHSSARLERYLSLCAQENLQVCCPTTPAQYFHLLRRQVHADFRKPLVIMTPKSLLRHPLVLSNLDEFSDGRFEEIIGDKEGKNAKRVLFCTGKIYYDLLEKRAENPCALVRLEQLYPFPEKELSGILADLQGANEWCWVQEEPENMGAWHFVKPWIEGITGHAIHYIGRKSASSPATGIFKIHRQEQDGILRKALSLGKEE